MRKKRHRDLQPWVDYFKMLQRYEECGYLQMDAEKHEAYVTRAALCTLSAGGPVILGKDVDDWEYAAGELMRDVPKVARRIRSYAAWMSREGYGYLSRPFALHAVAEDGSHDPLFTVLLSRRRTWRSLWVKADTVDVIDYGKEAADARP